MCRLFVEPLAEAGRSQKVISTKRAFSQKSVPNDIHLSLRKGILKEKQLA